jgi:hypothetical protein
VKLEFEILHIPILNFAKVKFYTIKKEGSYKSEFKDFFDKMSLLGTENKRVLEDLNEIRSQLRKIGEKFGACPKRFKPEGSVFALATHYPKRKNKDGIFGLRMFCLIISPQIVIILNGGDKTALKAQECENIKMKFHEAIFTQKVISDYLGRNGCLVAKGKELVNPDNDILYLS